MNATPQQEARKQAAITHRKKTEQDYKTRAAECLAEHEYTCLVAQLDVIAWRCKAPGTTSYAFDILMTRFGTAVIGDIDNLTFSVGLGYGMDFLAGKDVTYYIHSKLDENSKSRRFSEYEFHGVLLRGVARALARECAEELFEALPEWLQDQDLANGSHWSEFRQLLLDKHTDPAIDDDRWSTWVDLFDAANDIGFTEEAQVFMRDNAGELGLGEEWYEHRIDEPCQRLVQCLYMINHAAKAIIAQATAAAARSE